MKSNLLCAAFLEAWEQPAGTVSMFIPKLHALEHMMHDIRKYRLNPRFYHWFIDEDVMGRMKRIAARAHSQHKGPCNVAVSRNLRTMKPFWPDRCASCKSLHQSSLLGVSCQQKAAVTTKPLSFLQNSGELEEPLTEKPYLEWWSMWIASYDGYFELQNISGI